MASPVIVEYVWLSGKDTHHDIRSKCKTVYNLPAFQHASEISPEQLPWWNFDGSSTNQAHGPDTEILIKPVAVFPHPFITKIKALVTLCECFVPSTGEPTPDNTRHVAKAAFAAGAGHEPWFGLEQEYVLTKDGMPYGWPEQGTPGPQGPYFCSNGPTAAFGRKYAQEHYETCLFMGLKISGTNSEVMPGQWEFQVGPCCELECGDQMVMARWAYLRILEAVEESGLDVNYEVKPKKGDWNGSGMHCNFSTKATRAEGGLALIHEMLARLKETVGKDIVFYSGENNERLTGLHETSSLSEFTYGIGTRATSCRIPNDIKKAGKGYFEDRRPGSDADPYLVSARLFCSACGIPSPELDALDSVYRRPWMTELVGKQQQQQQ